MIQATQTEHTLRAYLKGRTPARNVQIPEGRAWRKPPPENGLLELMHPKTQELISRFQGLRDGTQSLMTNQEAQALLQDIRKIHRWTNEFWYARQYITQAISWPLLTEEPVQALRKHATGRILLDPMQGEGLLPRLIGSPVRGSDQEPGTPGPDLDAEAAVRLHNHPDALLLLAWPPTWSNAAERALRAFTGHRLAHWGAEPQDEKQSTEDSHGFFRLVQEDWQCIEEVPVTHWPYCKDRLRIYRRKNSA